MRVALDSPPALPTPQDIEPIVTEEQVLPIGIPSPKPPKEVSVGVKITPTITPLPEVTITAVKGNLFIRRGPDMAFNPVGILYEGSSAVVIAQDVLSKWVQIVVPDSDQTGWVSIQTKYSKVGGDLSSLPNFTPTYWPVAAYLRNCTYHRMYIVPGGIRLPSRDEYPENEIWLYPGIYTVYDIDMPDEPAVLEVDIREGLEVEIQVDGSGDQRGCP